MTLRFSEHGPEFPSALVDAILAGEVVFLCGAGISAPQLPGFKRLVEQAFERLGIEMDGAQRRSFDDGRFEEVLGALGRGLADTGAMVRTVSALLAVPRDPQLDNHRTVLRLSRDRHNRAVVVTTNFDTLLERAQERDKTSKRPESYAGQSLPLPGSADFSGIIHIHGRLADPAMNLDATPLVLTSADYGDAYMRSGWASRFLFDLARTKTIVLLGYSAGDAPVRYFLNVLEADRARFPDLSPVYAFDAYERDPGEALASWGTLAVTPIPYCKINPATKAPDHSPLWDDLRQLADITERPKQACTERARAILERDRSTLTDQQLRELKWLFTTRADLWQIVLETVMDPRWFHVLQDNELWSARDAAWVVSAWIAKKFESRQRFTTAVMWYSILGHEFLTHLDRGLRRAPPASPFWRKAWRLLLLAKPPRRSGISDDTAHALMGKLKSGLILDSELVRAVAWLAPSLVLRALTPRHREVENVAIDNDDQTASSELRLSDIAFFDLSVADDYSAEYNAAELVKALNALDGHAPRILELASEALRCSLLQSVDLGMIVDDNDSIDCTVPSIEEHDQNDGQDGLIFLIRLIANAFPKAVAADRTCAREQAAAWRNLPGRLGARLRLHAARDAAAFSADEAMQLVLDLKDADFWTIRRELALVLRDRANDANPAIREAVEARICTTDRALYDLYPLTTGQVEWRQHARDWDVWFRLKMLDEAGALCGTGRAELDAIRVRRPELGNGVEDHDFFNVYSYGARIVVGDSTPIAEATPGDRLKVVGDLRRSNDIERQRGWQLYCCQDPKSAFETLSPAELTPANIALWGDLLSALAPQRDEDKATIRDQIAVYALSHLESLDTEALLPIGANVINLLLHCQRDRIANLEAWCDRLWQVAERVEQEVDVRTDLYAAAINHPAGRLTQVLLAEHEQTLRDNGPHLAGQRMRLEAVADSTGNAGIMARAVLVRDLAYLLHADPALLETHLKPRLEAKTDESRALRAVLVCHGNITPEVTMTVPSAVLRGVVDTQTDAGYAEAIAAGVLRPALASVRGEEGERWGIGETDVRRALHDAPSTIRTGMLGVLARWMREHEAGGEEYWEKTVAPFFERVWPLERQFRDQSLNRHLLSLLVGAGRHFPAALEKLRHYLSPCTFKYASIIAIKDSELPEQFPDQVLSLLWLIFGSSDGNSHDLANVLDRLMAANPEIKIDRRFQSLESRAVRYD